MEVKRLKEICELIVDCPHSTAKDEGVGYPLIRTTNVGVGRLDLRGVHRVSERVYHIRNERAVPSDGDIILAREAPVGNAAIIMPGQKVCLGQRVVLIRANRNVVNPMFLVYYLLSDEIQHRLKNSANGAVVAHLNMNEIRELLVSIPDIKTQNRIAKILSSFDDKIDINHRINDNLPYLLLWMTLVVLWLLKLKNDNLEQQAQTIFKSWFVDFEPFKNGEFIESGNGLIPKGWRLGKLGELCRFKRGKNLLSKDAVPGNVPVVAGGLEPSCYHNVSNTNSPVITVSGSGANAGFMRMYHQKVWASDCSFIDSSCENLLFVYCFLGLNRHLLKHAQTGAVQPHVKPADIHDFDIVIPPVDVIAKFQKVIFPSIEKRGKLEQESCRLAEIRDSFLPRLMSGELKVNEIETIK